MVYNKITLAKNRFFDGIALKITKCCTLKTCSIHNLVTLETANLTKNSLNMRCVY